MRSTLPEAIELLRRRVPPTFEKQVRDHLAVHNRGGEACPRCGTKITAVKAGGFPTGVLPGLPALTPLEGDRDDQHLADLERARVGDVVGRHELLDRRVVA